MKVKILEVTLNELKNAFIKEGKARDLPSIQENWRFNFEKQLQKMPHSKAYVLVAEDTPKIIEGCLIFQMKNNLIPYMAFLEVAPHNKGADKRYDYVAGCLIAFAFKQSYIKAKQDYKGILFFDVQEEHEEDSLQLMRHYSRKYNAKKWDHTTMVIVDQGGDELIERYLSNV